MFSNLGMEQGREYGRDLYEDRLVRTIDRLYLLWVGLSLGLPFAVGYLVGGTLEAGLPGSSGAASCGSSRTSTRPSR